MAFEDLKKKISVVIQGPLDNRTYEAIDCYQDFGEVIVSTWSSGEDYRNLCLTNPESKFKLTTSHYPPNLKEIINHGAIYYIASTTFNGALVAEKEYTLKVRSDELYPNLDMFLENLEKYPSRLHTTDNGFWKRHPFCMSGHIFLDKTENMRNAMNLILQYCLGQKYQNIKSTICEQILGAFCMCARNKEFDNRNWKQIFRDNIYITKCVDLPGHLHSGQSSAGRGFKRSEEPYPCGRKEMPNGCHNPEELYQHIEEII
jgi:hypothetical protein